MARTVLPIVGGIVGAFVGYPQIGFAVGAVIGNAVDPVKVQGPKIAETGPQTSSPGAPRAIIMGTGHVTGNVIFASALTVGDFDSEGDKGSGSVTTSQRGFRTYAIRVCEGPIGGFLRIWENDKLVYDMRSGSPMVAESLQWAQGVGFYLGDETQLPDSWITTWLNPDQPAHRGTAYVVFAFRDVTDYGGAIPPYRFEVARDVTNTLGTYHAGPNSDTYPEHETYLTVDGDGNPVMIRGQSGVNGWEVPIGGSFRLDTFSDGFTSSSTPSSSLTIANAGNTSGDKRIWPYASDGGAYQLGFDANSGYCELLSFGSLVANLKPTSGSSDNWFFGEGSYDPEFGGLAWFSGDFLFLGVRQVQSGVYNCIFKFSKLGINTAIATSPLIQATSATRWWMHVSRSGIPRAISAVGSGAVQVFNPDDLSLASTFTPPSAISARFPSVSAIMAFGFDDARGWQAYMYSSSGIHLDVYDTGGTLKAAYVLSGGSAGGYNNRIIFTSSAIYIQNGKQSFMVDAPDTHSGLPMILSDVVDELHARVPDFPIDRCDTSELDDEVAGLVLAGDYSAADAINTLRGGYFFDKMAADGTLHYPKRGAAVVVTITEDDLLEDPDFSKREQAVEYVKKLHLQYQHAASGYAVAQATSARISPDAKVTGEATVQFPVTLTEDDAAQMVAKMHKVSWAEADGEFTIALPDSFLYLTPSDVIGLSLRGRLLRARITEAKYTDGRYELTLRNDRQSAYTSNVTGIPIPEPTPPPATIVGSTVLAVMDIPALVDTDDNLNYRVAVTGGQPGWYGATVQRSLDAGASFTNVATLNRAAYIGTLVGSVADASPYFTDRTNLVRVSLIRDGQSLDSISDAQFLQRQGSFALEKADGSWEIMQYRDAEQDSSGDFVLSTLHRGLLNSGTSAHSAGAKFVLLDERTEHIDASSTWLSTVLTHRAPSLSQAAELATEQNMTYAGRSQLEWPVASFSLSRNGNDVTATWRPRHRFGSDINPVASANFQGFRVTFTDGTTSETFDTTATTATRTYAATATVTVAALNRITGMGPTTSGSI